MTNPVGETRQDAFRRLATVRTRKVLNMLRVMQNLGKYPHDTSQTGTIVAALRRGIDDVEYALAGEKQAKGEEFEL
jgi:hypothetical protein